MVKKLCEDQILQFIRLYRENPCLWDITSEDYRNKPMRQSALQNLCNGMEIESFTVEDVKNKIKSLRSTYYLELDKIKKSSVAGDVYQPKLKWFDEFNSFIQNAMVKRKTHENTDKPSDQSGNSTYSNPEKKLAEPRKKRSKTQLSTIASSMKEMQHDLSKSETEEDEFDVFGKHVAKQLRILSTEQAILGQEQIQRVITKCRLHDLKHRNMTVSPAYSADTQDSDDYAPRPSTSSYMSLNSPASTVDTQAIDDIKFKIEVEMD